MQQAPKFKIGDTVQIHSSSLPSPVTAQIAAIWTPTDMDNWNEQTTKSGVSPREAAEAIGVIASYVLTLRNPNPTSQHRELYTGLLEMRNGTWFSEDFTKPHVEPVRSTIH